MILKSNRVFVQKIERADKKSRTEKRMENRKNPGKSKPIRAVIYPLWLVALLLKAPHTSDSFLENSLTLGNYLEFSAIPTEVCESLGEK